MSSAVGEQPAVSDQGQPRRSMRFDDEILKAKSNKVKSVEMPPAAE